MTDHELEKTIRRRKDNTIIFYDVVFKDKDDNIVDFGSTASLKINWVLNNPYFVYSYDGCSEILDSKRFYVYKHSKTFTSEEYKNLRWNV